MMMACDTTGPPKPASFQETLVDKWFEDTKVRKVHSALSLILTGQPLSCRGLQRMERFFEAKRVAVVGVSDGPENLGRAMIGNLIEFRFMGAVYAVGPKGGSFWGHKIYPSVRDLPERVDLAAVLVPATAVPEVLQQCGERG